MTLSIVSSPLAQGITLIGNGIHGGDLESATTGNWNPGFRSPPLGSVLDTIEYRTGPGLTATVGTEWIDSASADITQTITNTNAFDIAADTTVTLQIDFSRWEFGAGTRPEAIVNFYLGTTTLGTITFAMDTNGASTWSTFTVTDVAVAEGLGQTFRMETVTASGQIPSSSTQGFGLDNVRLTSTVAVPEPSTSLLGVVALGFALGRRRRA